MKNILIFLLLLAALTVAAQNYSPCYKEKYETGVTLYNKGDYNGAKAKFVAAKGCPMPNTAQADEWIKKCNAKLIPAPPEVSVSTDADGNQIFTVGDVTFKMVKVEGGTFTMGCTSEQDSDCFISEKPSHQVTLSNYYMGETEVTQALWKAVMGSNPSNFKGDELPVENVSWDDCQTFISKLNTLTVEKFRLSTEAEWEFAARGGNKSQPYKYAGSDTIGNVAWYGNNSGYKTHPVKAKNANELGLYDMSGNVLEWCLDRYGDYSSSAQTDPKSPSEGSYRVLRGGSWDNYAGSCRVSYRDLNAPDYRDSSNGFRLALVHQ